MHAVGSDDGLALLAAKVPREGTLGVDAHAVEGNREQTTDSFCHGAYSLLDEELHAHRDHAELVDEVRRHADVETVWVRRMDLRRDVVLPHVDLVEDAKAHPAVADRDEERARDGRGDDRLSRADLR